MEKFKNFTVRHFEEIIVVAILLATVAINLFTVYKIAFLQLYYLPILIAGYILGKRAVLFAILSILTVSLFMVFFPNFYFHPSIANRGKFDIIFNVLIWSGFLILTASIVGKLYEEKEKKIVDLQNAYVGVLEILTKYLESADRYTQGHSIRVSQLATEIAIAMGFSRNEVENIKTAGLLHDIGKIDVSMDIIQKASSLNDEERAVLQSHPEKGVQIVASVGPVLKEAIPLILAHHNYFMHDENKSEDKKNLKSIPIGARVIAVADTYDAIITDRPYRRGKSPWEAVEEIEKNSGAQFDPAVVEAFKRVVASKIGKD